VSANTLIMLIWIAELTSLSLKSPAVVRVSASARSLENRSLLVCYRYRQQIGVEPNTLQADPLPLKSFDICQSTASQISSIATVYDEKYGLDRAPPFISIYLQSAGIMHVITLKRRPQNMQASIGLRQCIAALKCMENLWPSAVWVRQLLEGAAVQLGHMQGTTGRPKRDIETAFGGERASNIIEREAFGPPPQEYAAPQTVGDNARLAQTLGLDVPGVEPSTSFYPGYQWWPRPGDDGFLYGAFPPTSVSTSGPSTVGTMATADTLPASIDTFPWDPQDLTGERYRSTYSALDPQQIFRDSGLYGMTYEGPVG